MATNFLSLRSVVTYHPSGSTISDGSIQVTSTNQAYWTSTLMKPINFSTLTGSTLTTGSFVGNNVGIGTATTTTALTIYKTDAVNYHRLTSLYINTPQAGIVLDSTQTTSGRKWNLFANTTGSSCTDGSLCIYDVAANRFNMVIDPSGNVGIGWTSPTAMLDVGGTIRSVGSGGGWVSMVPGSPNNTGYINFYNSDASRTAYLGFADASTMYLNIEQAKAFSILTNNAVRMLITSGGNVGIGITNPATSLQVNGTATASLFNSSSTTVFLSTSASTIYTIQSGQSGFIVVVGSGYNAKYMGWFEWTTGSTSANLVQLAAMSNSGVINVTLNTIYIQAYLNSGTCNVNVRVLLF
jgi:hypothetical protein